MPRLLFVGEAPGRDEDLAGEPFVGRSGKLLDRLMFEEIGITRSQCYIANVVKCRPPQNRNPAPTEIEACRPYLEEQISHINPSVVVTLGNFATRLLLDSARASANSVGRSTRSVAATSCRRTIRPTSCAPGERRWPKCAPTSSGPSGSWPDHAADGAGGRRADERLAVDRLFGFPGRDQGHGRSPGRALRVRVTWSS